jgi:hypothetical protein
MSEFKFSFETEKAYQHALANSTDGIFDIVRVKRGNVDFPCYSREEFENLDGNYDEAYQDISGFMPSEHYE